MPRKKQTDEDTKTALIVAGEERAMFEHEGKVLKQKEEAIKYVANMSGKIETATFYGNMSKFFTLLMLKRVKDSKAYKAAGFNTWEAYCKSLGLSRRWIDEQLMDLKPFHADFLEGFHRFAGVDISKIKYLGGAITGGEVQIEGSTILYKDRQIEVTPENTPEIQAFLEELEEEHKADKKAQARVSKAKDAHAKKLARQLDKLEGKAREKGLTPEEEGFLQEMENLRIGFDGYMLRVDFDRLREMMGEEATPRMKAAYVTTLGYMRKQIVAAHDEATDQFGMVDESAGWSPDKK